MTARDWTAKAREVMARMWPNDEPLSVEIGIVARALEEAYAAGQADTMAAVGLALHSRSELTPAQRESILDAVRWFR